MVCETAIVCINASRRFTLKLADDWQQSHSQTMRISRHFRRRICCHLATRAALDLIFSDYFSRNEPGVFAPLRDLLLTHRLGVLYAEPGAWAQKAILNVASSGKFSSDRSIAEYASEIWKVEPCPVL